MDFLWTDERLASLRDMFRHKFTASEMAQKLGCGVSRNAVCGKLHRLGLTRGITIRTARAAKPAVEQGKREGRPKLGLGAQVQAINRQKQTRPSARVWVMPAIQPPTSPEAVALRCVEVEPQHLSLLELTDKTCKWPYGEASPYSFCGNPPLGKTAYCGPHLFLSMR